MSIEENGEAAMISSSFENEYFKGKTETFSGTRFLLQLTQYIFPKSCQYI